MNIITKQVWCINPPCKFPETCKLKYVPECVFCSQLCIAYVELESLGFKDISGLIDCLSEDLIYIAHNSNKGGEEYEVQTVSE